MNSKVKCPTCGREYWKLDNAVACCQARRDEEDRRTKRDKEAAEIRRLVKQHSDRGNPHA